VSPKGRQKFAYAHSPNYFNWTRGATGFLIRRAALGVHSPTAASDGTVYFSTADGLVAVDPNSLNTLWSVPDGSGGAAIGTDGTVYVGGFSGFYAIH
jgi:outer membrane protein assembly factor BamB